MMNPFISALLTTRYVCGRKPLSGWSRLCIRNCATHVIEIDIDAVGASFFQRSPDIALLVIDRRIDPQLLFQIAMLVIAARDADYAAAFDPGNLADGHANGSGSP